MVGFKADFYWFDVGNWKFLYSFFSTVAHQLENRKWGSVYPHLMIELYDGKISENNLDFLNKELIEIKNRLEKLSPDKVIWNYENLDENPPWGNDISNDITNMSNYYVTCNGEDFIDVFQEAIQMAKEENVDLEITTM